MGAHEDIVDVAFVELHLAQKRVFANARGIVRDQQRDLAHPHLHHGLICSFDAPQPGHQQHRCGECKLGHRRAVLRARKSQRERGQADHRHVPTEASTSCSS